MKIVNTLLFRLLPSVLLLVFVSRCGENSTSKDTSIVIDLVQARNLGLSYLEESRLEDAELQFKKVIENAPDDAMGYANLGLVYLRKDSLDLAEEMVQRALQLRPEDLDVRLIMAEVYLASNNNDKAIETLEQSLEYSPEHAKSYYKINEIYERMSYVRPNDESIEIQRKKNLSELVKLAPASVPIRLQFIERLLAYGQTDSALSHLEVLNQQLPEPPKEAERALRESLKQMQLGDNDAAYKFFRILHNVLKVTPRYQADLFQLRGPGGVLTGFPILDFSENLTLQIQDQSAVLKTLRFTDATSGAGLDLVTKIGEKLSSPVLALGDFNGDKSQDFYYSIRNGNKTEIFLFQQNFGLFENVAPEQGISHTGFDEDAHFADIDNNGHLDLIVTNNQGIRFYSNGGEGKFTDISEESELSTVSGGDKILAADFDHDGDLDIYIGRQGPNQMFRNNMNGSFNEMAHKMKMGGLADSKDLGFGDFDNDGDLDIFVINSNGEHNLLSNLRQGQFEDLIVTSGLKGMENNNSLSVGDYNNDGLLDLFISGGIGTGGLFSNLGGGEFEKVNVIRDGFNSNSIMDAKFFDFDNDGYLDIVLAGLDGLQLFHNEGGKFFNETSHLLPKIKKSVRRIEVMDYNMDGDLDILLANFDGKLRLLRNDGGNVNKYLKVRLVGLRVGSGKNNHFGIGAKVEMRAGDLYQSRVVTGDVVHFGLGQKLKADVMRIIWTNGSPQNLFFPGSDQDIVEEQILKGSCPFLYTWDGNKFTFVKDILWRSALGMPMGIMAGEMTYAFSNSTEEYMKIPGAVLIPKNGEYTLQVTMELWETSYYDEIKLHVIDHPEGSEIYVDEKFIPPPYPPHRIYSVTNKRKPLSAMDGEENNLLTLIDEWDYKYISNMIPTQFQGITEPHDLVLDLGDLRNAEEVILFLHGWIFPTDASINVNISQNPDVGVFPPFVQVINENGDWETVIENIFFPNGKDKTCIVDLSGKFLTEDFRIRLRTSMQIYWDQVFFTVDEPKVEFKETILSIKDADLHYRGFSSIKRKGGRYGPHWPIYQTVSTSPKWRSLTGNYTRFGDVTSLLTTQDDMYVIMNSGDEMTINFPASETPILQKGWSRDFILYSDGWLKDGDLNTARGNTVKPLPFHTMNQFPYNADEGLRDSKNHQNYIRTYNTRHISGQMFGNKRLMDISK